MAGRARDGWRLQLPSAPPTARHGACVGLKLRSPTRDDAPALGVLMHDAYRGTIDDEGEDREAAVRAARAFFEGRYGGPALLRESVVAWRGQEPVGACLVGRWVERGSPFIAFVFTGGSAKRGGVGRLLLAVSVRRLSQARYEEVLAVVTRGNLPSEALFRSLGFEVFERREATTA